MEQPEFNLALFGAKTESLEIHGVEYEIRETNGQDEATLTNYTLAKEKNLRRLAEYLSGVITRKDSDNRYVSADEIYTKWPASSVYYAILKVRILSLGKDLIFPFTFEKGQTPSTMVEDLYQYLEGGKSEYAYKKPKPEILDAFNKDGYRYLSIEGKALRYRYLTLEGESKVLNEELVDSKATEIMKTRSLEYQLPDTGAWVSVQNFNIFPSSMMSKIRSDIRNTDSTFNPEVKIYNKTGQLVQAIDLYIIPAFFFPEEIL